MTQTTDVIIVGAGPVGLVAACALQQADINVVIFDKKKGATQTSNALMINMQTLQLLQSFNLSDQFIAAGRKLHGATMYSKKAPLAQIHIPSEMPYDFMLTLPQAKTEAILREHLHQLGVTIQQNWELVSYEQTNKQVTAHIQTPEGETTLSSQWLIGCDGAHSKVRKHSNIAYPGKDEPSHFVMIDAKLNTLNDENQYAMACLQPDLTLAIFPYNDDGTSRLLAEVSRSKQFNTIDYPSLDDMQRIAKQCLPFEHTITDLSWSSKFWVHEHLADTYRDNRIFLAGDAAHCHSPAGGFGMNTGIQDAINLCWKLALCTHHKANYSLLNTYQRERHPVGKHVVEMSSAFLHMLMISNPIVFYLRACLVKVATKIPYFIKRFMKTMHQLNIQYPNNMIVTKSQYKSLCAGMSMPDFILSEKNQPFYFYKDRNPSHFYVLCFTQFDEIKTLVQTHPWPITCVNGKNIQSNNQAIYWPKTGYIIIRPDAYIAEIGGLTNNVSTYFSKLFN